ncbi:MAG TPA: hypothetical protein VIK47_04945 [Kiloniellales bacterium]
MRGALGHLAALLLIASLGPWAARPAAAQQGDSVVLMGGGDEVYIAGLPAGWRKQAEASDALGHRADWLPPDQTLENWRDRLTVQLIADVAGQAPERFLDNLAALSTDSCEAVMVTEVQSASVNGYPAAARLIACTRDKQTGKGNVALYRVVAGARALYVLQRAYRLPPFTADGVPVAAADLEAGRAALAFGLACQRGTTTHPCPADWAPVLAPLDGSRPLVIFPAPG